MVKALVQFHTKGIVDRMQLPVKYGGIVSLSDKLTLCQNSDEIEHTLTLHAIPLRVTACPVRVKY